MSGPLSPCLPQSLATGALGGALTWGRSSLQLRQTQLYLHSKSFEGYLTKQWLQCTSQLGVGSNPDSRYVLVVVCTCYIFDFSETQTSSCLQIVKAAQRQPQLCFSVLMIPWLTPPSCHPHWNAAHVLNRHFTLWIPVFIASWSVHLLKGGSGTVLGWP